MKVDFPLLAAGHILRKLESPVVYNIIKDELYELDDEAFQFLKKCNGRTPFPDMLMNGKIDENIDFMLDEGIIYLTEGNELKIIKFTSSLFQIYLERSSFFAFNHDFIPVLSLRTYKK